MKLQLVNAGINCHNCNEYICHVHQNCPVLIRDLSVFGQVVYLKVPRRQFYCFSCKTSPTEILSWLNNKQRQTNRYQEYIYEKVSVAGHPRRSKDAVQDIFHKVAQFKKSGCAHAFVPRRFSVPSKTGGCLRD